MGLPRCTAVGIVLGWPSVDARILVRKLCFLKRLVLGDGSKLGSRMLRSLADDTETLSLVCECRELEKAFGTSFTDGILEAGEGEGPHPQEIRKSEETKLRGWIDALQSYPTVHGELIIM